MAITNFIPEYWSSALLTSLKKSLVFGDVVNRNYEGEIAAAGDTVRITSVSRPTISTYVPNSTTITYEQLADAQRTLVVDQAKMFNFTVDDVDRRQSLPGIVEEATREAAYALGDTIDQFIAGLYTGAINTIDTTAVTSTAANAYPLLVDLKVKLDQKNVPGDGRWVIVPPWYHGLLLKDNRFIDASASGSTEALTNGRVGRAAGFDVRVSNNAPLITGDDYAVIAGHNSAITYAEQINKVEALRLETKFADGIRGLAVYGAKLIRPDSIAVLTASMT